MDGVDVWRHVGEVRMVMVMVVEGTVMRQAGRSRSLGGGVRVHNESKQRNTLPYPLIVDGVR